MTPRVLTFVMAVFFSVFSMAQDNCRFIIVDQFGYLPVSKKIAVIKNPVRGFDSTSSFIPGESYSLVDVKTGNKVFTANITTWNNGEVDKSSGDQAWYFDFSAFKKPGTYFVLDNEKNVHSYTFQIAEDVYHDVLKQAMRTFFYQR